jgi:hypothetical protein
VILETYNPRREIVERSTRMTASIAVTLHELSVSGLLVKNSRIPARIDDFSQTGMRVFSPIRLMTFTSVLCDINCDRDDLAAQTIAQVRWVERHNSGHYRIGLQYLI